MCARASRGGSTRRPVADVSRTTCGDSEWVSSAAVARLLGVTRKTVTRWASEGRLASVKTARGHRRYEPATLAAVAGGHEGLVGVREASQRLNVGRDTVRRWAREGRVRSVRTAGGHLRLRRSEIDRIAFDDLVLPSQAAAALGLSRFKLSRLVASGRLEEFTTPGGHRRYRAADIEGLRRDLERAEP